MKQLLQSFGIGVVTIVSLWCFAMFAARHQEGVLGTVGYVVAAIIDLPIIYMYGPDPRHPPGVLVSVAVYLIEAIMVGLLVYLIFLKP